MISDKKFLREKFRAVRSAAKNDEKDNRIYELITKCEAFINADTVFAYYSVGSEADTLRIIHYALTQGKRVALPKCTDSNGNMDFYFIHDIGTSLKDGMFSLREPDADACEKAYSRDDSICIVPALAIDKSGCRLGYGGGYYDRFLSDFKGRTIGLCYEECLCEMLPCDRYDIRLNMIITDNKIYALK